MKDELFYNQRYHLFRDGKYLGIATWVEDGNVGDHFNQVIVDADGSAINLVYKADMWVRVEPCLS